MTTLKTLADFVNVHTTFTTEDIKTVLKDTTFYTVNRIWDELCICPCVIEKYREYTSRNMYDCRLGAFTRGVLSDGSLDTCCTTTEARDIYLTLKAAEEELATRERILSKFRNAPFVDFEILKKHEDQLAGLEEVVNTVLDSFEDYAGIDFCDVGASGIQVRLFNKKVRGCAFGDQFTIKYDFSNINEAPRAIITEFVKRSNKEFIDRMNDFMDFGNKYGWD